MIIGKLSDGIYYGNCSIHNAVLFSDLSKEQEYLYLFCPHCIGQGFELYGKQFHILLDIATSGVLFDILDDFIWHIFGRYCELTNTEFGKNSIEFYWIADNPIKTVVFVAAYNTDWGIEKEHLEIDYGFFADFDSQKTIFREKQKILKEREKLASLKNKNNELKGKIRLYLSLKKELQNVDFSLYLDQEE